MMMLQLSAAEDMRDNNSPKRVKVHRFLSKVEYIFRVIESRPSLPAGFGDVSIV